MVYCSIHKLFSFMGAHLLIIVFSTCSTGVMFKKLSSMPMSSSISPIFSSISYSVSCFMMSSSIHLDLSFTKGNRYGSICIPLQLEIQIDQQNLLKVFSFHYYEFLSSVSKIRFPWVCGFITESDLIPLINLFLCQTYECFPIS